MLAINDMNRQTLSVNGGGVRVKFALGEDHRAGLEWRHGNCRRKS
jgi:hypothetical protein